MYNPKTTKVTTVKKGLHFPNGILVSPDEKYLLVSEGSNARILKLDLTKKDKKGHAKVTVWADGLPVNATLETLQSALLAWPSGPAFPVLPFLPFLPVVPALPHLAHLP
jgi:glucose/arabinose dehydrogenase